MKLKVINYVSAVLFFLSSASLLFIPFLNFEEGFPKSACFLALTFWTGLFAGVVLQVFLWLKTRKFTIIRYLKKSKVAVAAVFALSVISCVLVVSFFDTNIYALPVNLFVILQSAELFWIIKRMERL